MFGDKIIIPGDAFKGDVERGSVNSRTSPLHYTSEHGTDEFSSDQAGILTRTRNNRFFQFLLYVLIMIIKLSLVVGFTALIYLWFGPMFVAQLAIIAVVAYLAAGGGYRWLYVALRTAPRDISALCKFIGILLTINSYQRNNRTVWELFQKTVRKHPNKVCFIFEDKEWTFQQVDEYSNRVAQVFYSAGYSKGKVVALLMENRPQYACCWLGLNQIGVIVPLINYNLRQTSLIHSLQIAKCDAIIYEGSLSSALAEVADKLNNITFYRWDDINPIGGTSIAGEILLTPLLAAAPVLPVGSLPDKPGYNEKIIYIYTSGTTGLPKAAVITNARFAFITVGLAWAAGVSSSDRIYMALPMYHTAGGIMNLGQALVYGCTVVIRKKFSASAYFPEIRKYNCTVSQYIGEMCRYILATPISPDDKRHKLRLIFGNGLRPQIWKEFVERFNVPRVAEFYGATEGNANIVNMDNTFGAIGFVSRIIPSLYPISIIRVDEHTGEAIRGPDGLCIICKPGEPGAFIGKITKNPSRAFLGYVDKSATEKKIVHDVFCKGDSAFFSGDLLVSDELGYLYFKDRTGDTFRWKGENVSTAEVEAVLSNVANYKDAAVYGVEIPGNEGRAGMAAILDIDNSIDLQSLFDGVMKLLPSYARPVFIRKLAKMDMTGTYKIKKKDLQEEGFDPSKTSDPIYYMSKTQYELLTPCIYSDILTGKIRL